MIATLAYVRNVSNSRRSPKLVDARGAARETRKERLHSNSYLLVADSGPVCPSLLETGPCSFKNNTPEWLGIEPRRTKIARPQVRPLR